MHRNKFNICKLTVFHGHDLVLIVRIIRPIFTNGTDWSKFWAPEEDKHHHPPYCTFYRYTRDLIGNLNHNMVGCIDWNMVLNTRGGPNYAHNFYLVPCRSIQAAIVPI